MNETIVAISTPQISGPIGIVRMSGPKSFEVLEKIFKAKNEKEISTWQNRNMVYGTLFSRENIAIDSCMAVKFEGPNTYTGENMVEIQCHGSLAILKECLMNCIKHDCRMAQGGEFTKRAFLSGKMDLMGAEAVHDLINAKTVEVAQNSAGQVCGIVSKKIENIRENLLDLIAHYHAVVDYPDEDIDDVIHEKAIEILKNSTKNLYELAESYENGKIIRDGVDCVILGKPNVGKSSILNALSGTDKAIVTEIEGTTRDIIEEHIKAGPIVLKISDTAGLRDTTDQVEKIGVERAMQTAQNAKIVLAVFDSSREIDENDLLAITRSQDKKAIAILNKCDMPRVIDLEKIKKYYKHVIEISAKNGENIEKITQIILEVIGIEGISYNGEIITNARQARAITKAAKRCEEAYEAAKKGMTPDAITMDAEGAIAMLGEITGRSLTDDVLDKIFTNFCVGK